MECLKANRFFKDVMIVDSSYKNAYLGYIADVISPKLLKGKCMRGHDPSVAQRHNEKAPQCVV